MVLRFRRATLTNPVAHDGLVLGGANLFLVLSVPEACWSFATHAPGHEAQEHPKSIGHRGSPGRPHNVGRDLT